MCLGLFFFGEITLFLLVFFVLLLIQDEWMAGSKEGVGSTERLVRRGLCVSRSWG